MDYDFDFSKCEKERLVNATITLGDKVLKVIDLFAIKKINDSIKTHPYRVERIYFSKANATVEDFIYARSYSEAVSLFKEDKKKYPSSIGNAMLISYNKLTNICNNINSLDIDETFKDGKEI